MGTGARYRGQLPGPSGGPLWPDPEEGPFAVYTHWAEIDGRLECVGLSLSSVRLTVAQTLGGDVIPVAKAAVPVPASALRKAPWQRMMTAFREAYTTTVRALDLPEPPPKGTRSGAARGGRPSQFTDEEWAEKAAAYVSAVDRGLPPAKHLAAKYGVSVEKARNWAAAMRRRGFDLPPPAQGRPSKTKGGTR